MAQRRLPFDFDLNEPPPPENDAPAAPVVAPEPAAQLHDPVPEPSPRHDDPAPEPSSHGQMPAPVPEPSSHGHGQMLAPVPEAAPEDPLPAPVPAPAPEPSPYDSLHPPSPVLDLEAPLSSLDEDDDEHDYEDDEADLPPPPPLPASLSRAVSPIRRQGDRAASQAPPHGGTPAPRGPSRDRASSDTKPFQRSRRRWDCPYDDYEPREDAVSKQRRADYDDDAGSSSRSGSRRSEPEPGPPARRHERPELVSSRPYEHDGGWRGPATLGPPRIRRRRRPRPQRWDQYEVTLQRQQQGRGREQPQGFRAQERPQAHHGPRYGPEAPKVGYSPLDPMSGPFVGWNSSGARLNPKQEPMKNNGNGGHHHPHQQQQRRETPPPMPSSGSRGSREDSFHGQQGQAHEPYNVGGGYQHRESSSGFRPSSNGAHGGRDGSSGGR